MDYQEFGDTTQLDTPRGLGCALEMFNEKTEVLAYINELPKIYQDSYKAEKAFEDFMKILDQYQEQPHLLDKALPELINSCLGIVRPPSIQLAQIPPTSELSRGIVSPQHLSLKYLRHVFKVRGYKKVIQRMPHEISDLVPVVELLESVDLNDPNLFESTSVLIYWLSILVMNPFDLKLLDNTSGDKTISIAQRILNICMNCISLNNSTGRATPVLVAKFLTRPDMLKRDTSECTGDTPYDLESFFGWCCENVARGLPFSVRRGAFSSLAALFKEAKREEIIKYGKKVLDVVLDSGYDEGDTLLRKMGTKLVQRIGIMFMKTKVAPWRYQRGSRSLVDNLQPSRSTSVKIENTNIRVNDLVDDDSTQYEELSLFAAQIESVLDQLLKRLEDKDTVVRWSAAKGIGRVVTRLPMDYGTEIVGTILRLFSSRETSGAWQGGCLALAELARKGLLLPTSVKDTVLAIQQALVYDEVRGNFSVGSQVRDASCYVLWALARCFEPEIIQPFVHDIATSLIITMVFDREVNCRRAAAAAFQENVGRQGNFPHGMDIISVADYVTVGNRVNAFTKVSVEIAKYPAYTRPMIDHLIQFKFHHYDPSIRELTSKTLANLVHLDPEYMLSIAMDKLLPVTTVSDIATSHGAILCFSSVMEQLSHLWQFEMKGNNQVDIRNIALSIIDRQFRPAGHQHHGGHELLRQALNFYIKCCSVSILPFHNDTELLDAWYGLLEENISFYETKVRESAADALPAFLLEYYYYQPNLRNKVGYFIGIFCQNLSSSVMTTRIGYANAIGKLPLRLLKDVFPTVINSLITCAQVTSTYDNDWTESRRDAINALANIFSNNITKEPDDDWKSGIPIDQLVEIGYMRIWDCFANATMDYTTDKRGDIGSFVREAGMSAMRAFMIALHNYEVAHGVTLVKPEQYTRNLAFISKQCVEKIDNVRVHAGKEFSALLHHSPALKFANHSELVKIFPKEVCAEINWRTSSVTFKKFAGLLAFPEYSAQVLCGFVISGGSLSDTVVRDSINSVEEYLEPVDEIELRRIADLMLQLFKDNQKNERISLPLLKFWSHILQSGIFYDILSDTESNSFGEDLINCVKVEIHKTTKMEKIFAGIEILSELLQGNPEVVSMSLKRLVLLLCHPYPRVRITTSRKLYEAMISYRETIDKDCDNAFDLLTKTKWDSPVKELREVRNEFCRVMNIPIPASIVPEAVPTTSVPIAPLPVLKKDADTQS